MIEILPSATLLYLVVGTAVGGQLARRHAALWSEARAIALPAGHSGSPPAGPPALLSAAAALSIALGLMTLTMFAPMGLALAGIVASKSAVVGVALLALSLHGLGLGTGLCRAAGALYRRDRDYLDLIARRSVIHHAAVVALFLYLDAQLAALVAIPSGVAGLLALAYRRAAW